VRHTLGRPAAPPWRRRRQQRGRALRLLHSRNFPLPLDDVLHPDGLREQAGISPPRSPQNPPPTPPESAPSRGGCHCAGSPSSSGEGDEAAGAFVAGAGTTGAGQFHHQIGEEHGVFGQAEPCGAVKQLQGQAAALQGLPEKGLEYAITGTRLAAGRSHQDQGTIGGQLQHRLGIGLINPSKVLGGEAQASTKRGRQVKRLRAPSAAVLVGRGLQGAERAWARRECAGSGEWRCRPVD